VVKGFETSRVEDVYVVSLVGTYVVLRHMHCISREKYMETGEKTPSLCPVVALRCNPITVGSCTSQTD